MRIISAKLTDPLPKKTNLNQKHKEKSLSNKKMNKIT